MEIYARVLGNFMRVKLRQISTAPQRNLHCTTTGIPLHHDGHSAAPRTTPNLSTTLYLYNIRARERSKYTSNLLKNLKFSIFSTIDGSKLEKYS